MQRHTRSLLFMIALLVVVGVLSALQLPTSLFPDIQFPRAQVSLDNGDRPAEQMATLVTMPAEEALRKVPNVRGVESTTSRGAADISVNFDWGTDMYQATLQLQTALTEAASQLPPGTNFTVRRMDPTVFPVIAYSLTSKNQSLAALHDLAQLQLRPLLSSIEGVAKVDVAGGEQDEIEVEIDPLALAAHHLSPADVTRAIAASNTLTAAGRIESRYKLYLLVANAQLTNLAAVQNVIVAGAGTPTPIRLGQVAKVSLGATPQWVRVTADGTDAVLINVYQQPGANSVTMARQVRDTLDAAKAQLPPGVTIANWYDQSELVVASQGSVRDAILIGVVLAALTLLVFLRNWKITVIAIALVPTVMAPVILLLKLFGMGFNIMTLGGMAAAVGLVIDDGIVMIEHIMRRVREGGRSAFEGSVMRAAQEFTRPLVGSSSATIVIFIPLAFLSGVTGAFFKALSITMASALLISFLFTWLAVPLVCNKWLTARDAEEKEGRLAHAVQQRYQRLLARVSARPWWLLVGIVPLVLVSLLAFARVGSGFMPAMDEGGFVLDYHSTPGTSVSETDRMVRQVETILRHNPNVLTWSRRTGAGLGGGLSEPNKGDFFVRLKAGDRQPIDAVMTQVRAEVEHSVPGLTIELAQLMEDLIGDLTAVPQPIQVKLYGDDPDQLAHTAQAVAQAMAKVQGVVDVNDGLNPAGDSLELQVSPQAAAAEGVDPQFVSQAVTELVQGVVATSFTQGSKTVGIRVRTAGAMALDEQQLANLQLRAPDGHLFPLKRVAQLVPVVGEKEISRDNLRRVVSVTARLENRDLGSTVADVQKLLGQQHTLPRGVTYEMGGLFQQQQIAFHGLMLVFGAATALVFALLLWLYESFLIALAVMLMPLLAAGAVFIGLWLTGIELNISAMMGMTMIIGIVTEVAIFYISELQTLMKDEGLPLHQALLEAGANRLRPIAMTTIAATLALLPLAIALGAGSAMQQPLAIAIISGLVVQMPLVLVALPALLRLLLPPEQRL